MALNYTEEMFLEAAKYSFLATMSACIKKGVNVNCLSLPERLTALHMAVDQNNMAMVKLLLLCHCVNVNIQCIRGYTPLHVACMSGNFEIVKLLLLHKAKPNIKDILDKTALHMAIVQKNVNIVSLLISRSADVNVIDTFQNTPLSLAFDQNLLDVFRLLLVHGANPNLSTKRIPLFLECSLSGHTSLEMKFIQLLLDFNVNFHVIDNFTQRNALHFACITGYEPLVLKLLELGINYNHTDILYLTPKDIAQQHENINAFKLICDFECAKDSDTDTV